MWKLKWAEHGVCESPVCPDSGVSCGDMLILLWGSVSVAVTLAVSSGDKSSLCQGTQAVSGDPSRVRGHEQSPRGTRAVSGDRVRFWGWITCLVDKLNRDKKPTLAQKRPGSMVFLPLPLSFFLPLSFPPFLPPSILCSLFRIPSLSLWWQGLIV